ncbi:UNVERIFIED_CONTAM: Mechanosensitive ion channel protein 10 [Sesamum calycinum]|uniref:Mechanosensitive ion channel protein 10 n=1 Tax=Sesamum calycinum TaxID=2727403 RepID=A0AAW2QVZ5_9LAMI
MDANGKAPKSSGEISMTENQKRATDVVINVPGDEKDSKFPTPDVAKDQRHRLSADSPHKESSDSAFSAQKSVSIGCPSPEIVRIGPSSNKPPKIPTSETLTRRKSLSRSVYSKPKSRFGEQSVSIDGKMFEENGPSAEENVISTRNSPNTKLDVNMKETSSLTVHWLQNLTLWGLPIWKWCVLVLVTFSGLLVTEWLMHFVVLLIELNFLLKKKEAVKGSRLTTRILDFITWTIAAMLIGAFLWLLKTLLLKILASSFHVNTFFDRIQESIFHQYILLTLSGPPVLESAQMLGKTNSNVSQFSFRVTKKGKEGKEKKEKEVIDINKLHQMKQEKVSAWTMKMLVDVISNSGLTTLSNAIDESVYDGGNEQADKEITNEEEAIAAAYHIFRNVAQPGYYDESMLKEEVELILPMIDVAETGQIDRKALTDWVVKVYKGRKALAHALNDTKTATIFEAIIFVFVMHPFDVGDRCVVDGVQVVVEEMNILTTVFLKSDNEKVYYPNAVLATKPISNFYRSPDMGDSLDFCIDFKTPMEKIGALKRENKEVSYIYFSPLAFLWYLEKTPQHWHPNHNLVVKEIENVNKIKMTLFFNHTMNFQDYPEKSRRKRIWSWR